MGSGIAQVAAIFTTAKWLMVFAIFMMLAVKLVELGLHRFGNKAQLSTKVLVISLVLLLTAVAMAILVVAGMEF